MATWQPDLAPLVNRIPRLYFLLRAVGDALHADLGVSTGMRGVMTSLADGAGKTVPEMARERPVSRQHVQTLVNDLLAAGLAQVSPNPSHRRSPIVTLTEEGRRRLRILREREAELLAAAAPAVSQTDLAATGRLFDVLERELAGRAERLTESSQA
jgi:DNA-binding MarR family transcriptional regulator